MQVIGVAMWDIRTIEADLSEAGEHTFSYDTRPGDEPAEEVILVLVEQLEGENGGLEVALDGIDLEQISQYERVKAFTGRVFREGSRFGLRLWTRGLSGVRITFARIRNAMGDGLRRLPCRVCKQIMKALLCAGLAAIGVPYLDTEVIELVGEQVEWLRRLFEEGQLADVVSELGIDQAWTAIRLVLMGLNFVFDLGDNLFTEICYRMGFCFEPGFA